MELELKKITNKKGHAVKAITLAFLIDIIGSAVLFMACIFLYTLQLMNNGLNETQVLETLTGMDLMSPLYLSGFFLISLVSCYAGYFCAKVSEIHEYRNVAILSLINSALGSFLVGHLYSVENIILAVGNMVIYFIGAYLWKRKNRMMGVLTR
ncbi:hypothetical protein ACFFUP_10190 [Vibrio ostreicida]|uniref:Uncharacterized protein n=1 Tax=Vibrio ostreicida TaxID=526588 RepID=A0ABT8BZI7_9VIBR|nr:hypothetical protein [Vibrio ostreicida]MDN3612572.1 hypothetical protein [Vibrio ostreicida]